MDVWLTMTGEQISTRLQLMLASPLPEYQPAVMARILIDELQLMPGITEESTAVLLGVAALLMRQGIAMQVESALGHAMRR